MAFASSDGALEDIPRWTSTWPVLLLTVFIVGWTTYCYSVADFGRYSIPLIYIAAFPFCFYARPASLRFVVFFLMSLAVSITVAVFEDSGYHLMSQLALQVLALLFTAGISSLDWPHLIEAFTRIMTFVGSPLIAFGGYQMIARWKHLPYAYLPVTNQQYYSPGGLQLGWEKPDLARASSLFSEPSEFGFYCLWLFALGLASSRPRVRAGAIVLALTGILFSQSLSAVLGLGAVLLAYLFTQPLTAGTIRQIALIVVVSAIAISIIVPLVPDTFSRFSERITQAVSLDSAADSGRVDHLPENWRIFTEAPFFGHGLASESSALSDGLDVTTVLYAMLLMERGIVGAALFLTPWCVVALRSLKLPLSVGTPRTAAILLCTVTLFGFSIFSMTPFLPFWLALGICVSLTNAAPKLFSFRQPSLDTFQRQA